jgi:L-fuculose-phosphate aldolase
MRLGRLRRELAAAARSLAALDLADGAFSLSARDPDSGWRLITPAGADPARLAARDLVLLSAAGHRLDPGPRRPSPDARVHLRAYASVPDAGAVVIARPSFAAALAQDSRHLPPVTRRLTRLGGGLRCLPYAPAGSEALARLVADALGRRRACLVAQQGVVAVGADPSEAVATLALVDRISAAYLALLVAGMRVRPLGARRLAAAADGGGTRAGREARAGEDGAGAMP